MDAGLILLNRATVGSRYFNYQFSLRRIRDTVCIAVDAQRQSRKFVEISGNYRGVDVTVATVLAEGEARAFQPQSSITVQ
jgi:hypothetical protein